MKKVRQTSRWRRPDGTWSTSRSDARLVSRADVLELARRFVRRIPPGWILGVAERESARVFNQEDTDYDERGQPRPVRTYGLLMMNYEEARRAARLSPAVTSAVADLVDPAFNVAVGVTIFEQLLDRLIVAARLNPAQLPEATWLYLAWSHNAGFGEVLASINRYGFDWDELVRRNLREGNAYVCQRLIPYAEYTLKLAQSYPRPGRGLAMV